MRAWEAWCRAKGVPPAPAAPSLVANHLAELAGSRAYVTLTSRLSAIAQAHALLRLLFDARDPELRKTLQGIARAHGTKPQRQAAPLLTADVVHLAAICGGSLRGERDRALLLLGFAGAFRRSELVAISVDDFRFGPHGFSVFLPRSKADPLGEGSTVHVASNPLAAHCPVAAVRSWLQAAGIREGWVFEEDLARISPHQPAQPARRLHHHPRQASIHERDIMQHSRHGSQTVMRGYIRAAATPEAFTSGAVWRDKDVICGASPTSA